MSDFRKVTETFWVAPQIEVPDVARAKSLGFTLIINNRPDGEAPGQPTGAEIEAAALAAGIGYMAAPVVGMPQAAQVDAVRNGVAGATKTLAYCRSGTRSIMTWALGQTTSDNRAELARAGADAGYDLTPILGI